MKFRLFGSHILLVLGLSISASNWGCLKSSKKATYAVPDSLDSERTDEVLKVRKLTFEEMSNSLQDNFGLSLSAAVDGSFPAEDSSLGAKNIVTLNNGSTESISLIADYSFILAAQISQKSKFAEKYFSECAHLIECDGKLVRFIQEVGGVFHKRALSDDELAPYKSLVLRDPTSIEDAIQILLATFLQSPHFQFQLDRFSEGSVDLYSFIAYASLVLWKSSPDQALLKKIADLSSKPRKVAARELVDSMIADPRSIRGIRAFFREWWSLDVLDGILKDPGVLGFDVTSDYIKDTKEEVLLYVDDLWRSELPLHSIFDSKYTYITSNLAGIYGLPYNGTGFRKTELNEGSQRFGFLSSGAFSLLMSSGYYSSPTKRGLFIMKKFLCQSVPPPPPGLGVAQPDELAKGMTPRARISIHQKSPSCKSCHILMDPLGLAFEKYDGAGRYRDNYSSINKIADFGPEPISTTGSFASNGQTANFESAKDLSKLIAEDRRFSACFSRYLIQYLQSQKADQISEEWIQEVDAIYKQNGGLLSKIIKEALFLKKFADGDSGEVK